MRTRIVSAAATGMLLGGSLVTTTASAAPDENALRAANVRALQVLDELPYGKNDLGALIATSGADADGAVTVTLANYSDGLAERMRARYGTDLVVKPGELPKVASLRIDKSDSLLNRKDDVDPLLEGVCSSPVFCSPTRGGVLLEAAKGDSIYHCSATVLGTVAGAAAATLTAGHCFDLSATVWAGRSLPDINGYALGTVTSRRFSGTVDAEAIRWSASGSTYNYLNNCVYVHSNDCRRMTAGGGGSAGMSVQKSGITTGVTSGTITRASANVNIRLENGTIVALTDQFETSACVRPGDSGGPLYSNNLLLGISSSVGGLDTNNNCTTTTRSYFSKISASVLAVGFSPRYTA